MDKEYQILNSVYQISLMGIETAKHLLSRCEDKDFIIHLNGVAAGYHGINDEAAAMMAKSGSKGQDIPMMAKWMTNIEIKFKSMQDNTPSHMAEMMLEGNVMGLVEGLRSVKACNDAPKEALDIAGKLIKFIDEDNYKLREFV